jgi:hypothetical protein
MPLSSCTLSSKIDSYSSAFLNHKGIDKDEENEEARERGVKMPETKNNIHIFLYP